MAENLHELGIQVTVVEMADQVMTPVDFEIAAEVHLNPAYFSTLFKKNMGKGFREYLAALRITAVKKHLRSSTERIKDIAAAEGFDDYPYFCRLFKSLVGQTPQEYRAKP